ncbi:MAG: UDP-diphosphatase [Pseudonocardiales bacterium]|nr:phosphatase PAP2 family protein [Actinomycetota bacterium]PZS23210.1 MAG: UDP-diphosphatase [Pseudonocardiales bacterium]
MIDTHLFDLINAFARATPWLHGVMTAYALWAGLVVLALLLVAGWWWTARYRQDAPRAVATAVLTGVAAVVAVLVNQNLFSPAIGRVRPCRALAPVEVLLPCSNDYSMPSDHTVIGGAFVIGLLILSWRLGRPAVLLALLLAFSRVYVGVHYPADTVVGLLLGAVIGAVVVLGGRRGATTLAQRLTRTRLRALVTARPTADLRSPRLDRVG